MSELLISALRAAAAKWRANNKEHLGGIVLLWGGTVYGWKNELRDPKSERPGAYAVDMAGLVFKAVGGNDYDGAEAWVALDPDEL